VYTQIVVMTARLTASLQPISRRWVLIRKAKAILTLLPTVIGLCVSILSLAVQAPASVAGSSHNVDALVATQAGIRITYEYSGILGKDSPMTTAGFAAMGTSPTADRRLLYRRVEGGSRVCQR
jgi:hypothetical protein